MNEDIHVHVVECNDHATPRSRSPVRPVARVAFGVRRSWGLSEALPGGCQ